MANSWRLGHLSCQMPHSGDQKRGQMPRPQSSLQQFSLIIQLNSVTQWRIQREGLGGTDPTLRPLRLKFFHRQDHISLFNSYWLIFLIKCALHFASKLNSRDIQKCNCSYVHTYDLFASARKAVFPEPTASGIHGLRNTLSSLLSQ